MAVKTPLVMGADGLHQLLQAGDTLAVAGGGGASDLLSPLTAAEIAVTTGTTLTATAFGRLHDCTGTTADYTVTLPTPTGNAGKIVGVRMAPGLTRLVTIDAGAGVLIDGQQTRVLWAQESAVLLCDGTGWAKIAGRTRAMSTKLQRQGASQSAGAAYLQGLLDTQVSGLAGMFDSANNRATVLRPGSYSVTAFAYNSGTGALAVGCALNAAANNSAVNNGYAVAGAPAGAAFLNTFVAATGDYFTLWYYGLSGAPVALGATAGSYPQLVVTETPSW